MSTLLFVLGSIIAISGFYWWYAKVQKINDKILDNEEKEKQSEKIRKKHRVRPI